MAYLECVCSALMQEDYQIDNIEGDREQYSEQELRIIDKLKGMLRE